jgi:uncharacterized protein
MTDATREFTAAAFHTYLNEGKLMGSRCVDTGEIFVPPRAMCPRTYSTNMEWVELSGRARLLTFTTVHIGTTAMVRAGYDRQHPYCAGIVELAEGPRFSAQIVGVDALQPETIQIGQSLEAEFIVQDGGNKRQSHLVFRAL